MSATTATTAKTIKVMNTHPHTLLAKVDGRDIEIPGGGKTTEVPEAALAHAGVRRHADAGHIVRLV